MKGRKALARRYRYLWTGELVAAGVFLSVFALLVPLEASLRSWVLRAYGVTILVALLVQGAVWWRGRLHDLLSHRRAPDRTTLCVFGGLRRMNWALIGGFPLVVLWRHTAPDPIAPEDLGWSVALILVAALEQVNYYHYQLSYGYGLDSWYLRRHRRLRRGNIARHLDSARA